jgi:hypothetical protein
MASKLLRETVKQLQNDLDLELSDLASALKANPRTMERWYNGETFPQHEYRQRIDELMALRDRLYESLESGKLVRQWLHTDNRYLGRIKPAEALRAGRIDRVRAALEAMDAGIFV